MSLVIIKNHDVLCMPDLVRFGLKYIYDEENMKAEEVRLMMESIDKWKKHLDLKTELGMSAVDEENLVWLEKICVLLKKNDEGLLDNRKRSFKEHQIDYRKFHRMPEAYTAEGLHKAAEMKREYDKKHPEQEGLI